MGSAGLLICNVMAVVWAAIAVQAAHAPLTLLMVPIQLSAMLFGFTRARQPAVRDGQRGKRAMRVILLCTLAEALVIVAGVNMLVWLGLPGYWACLLAATVALHFLPMAKWMPAPRLYLTASGLLAAAGAGCAVPGPLRTILVGSLAAATLWGTCATLLIRPRAKQA